MSELLITHFIHTSLVALRHMDKITEKMRNPLVKVCKMGDVWSGFVGGEGEFGIKIDVLYETNRRTALQKIKMCVLIFPCFLQSLSRDQDGSVSAKTIVSVGQNFKTLVVTIFLYFCLQDVLFL